MRSTRQNGRQRFDDLKHHALAARLGDFGEVGLLVVGDFEALSGLDPQDARQVASFVAAQFRGSAVNRIYKKSTPCQISWWHKAASRARILPRY
jgi:hypothetical protein